MLRSVAFALLLVAARAGAAECPAMDGGDPSLASIDGAARLKFLQLQMHHAARQSRIWAWSSAGVLLFASQIQLLGATHVPDPGDRIDLTVGAVSLIFSLLQLAVLPPRVMFDEWTLKRHVLHAGPDLSDSGRCALLAEAERYLVRDARSEEIGTSRAVHAITMLFNIGVGLFLGIGYDRWTSAAINIFVGVTLGELQILTEPTETIDLLKRYRAGDLGLHTGEKQALRWQLFPSLDRQRYGMTFALAF